MAIRIYKKSPVNQRETGRKINSRLSFIFITFFFKLMKTIIFGFFSLLRLLWQKTPRSWKLKLFKTGSKLKKTRAGQLLLTALALLAASPLIVFYRKQHRKILPIMSGIAAMLLILAIYKSQQATTSKAAWFNDGWMYRQSIPVTYTGSESLTEYQVLIDSLDTATLVTAGKLQSDCDDLRFTNINGKLLSRDASETLYLWMIAPWGDATVTAYASGSAISGCTGITITSAGSNTSCASVGAGAIRVSSDVPILLFTQPTNYDYIYDTTASNVNPSDLPVVAHYQQADSAEENLMHYPMMRQFTYPTPAVGSLGSEEQSPGPVG